MKKITLFFALILSVLLSLSFMACGGETSQGTSNGESNSQQSEQSSQDPDNNEDSLPTDWFVACDGASVSIIESGNYIKEGSEWSLKYAHENTTTGNTGAGVKFNYSSAQDMGSFDFSVYNPTSNAITIEVFLNAKSTPEIFQDYKTVSTHVINPGEWTEISVNGRTLASTSSNGAYDVIGIAVLLEDNGETVNSNLWKSIELYFDGLQIFFEVTE
ncbi:MAG: hypothetical protein IKJ19_00120 [Clostridia bacterium]|nr:hypothetical protein [Clostridia bacterium]